MPPVKLYYTVKEVADYVGVLPSKIRYWETKICTLHSRKSTNLRSSNDERRFSERDIQRIKCIKALMDTGEYTNKGVKELLTRINFID
jgi:DNA-binding transcriptional MerR regulator